MKPLQHAQISRKTYGGSWQDYIEVHSFLDSSKAACAHFKHRFFLHHREGIELGAEIFGESVVNSDNEKIPTRRLLTDHLIEDVGREVTVDDWANALFPRKTDSFYKFLKRRRDLVESGEIRGENELLRAFNLKSEDIVRVKAFLNRPLGSSSHPAALLVTHNSFGVFLAEKLFGCAFVKDVGKVGDDSKQRLVAVREVFERLIFLRMKSLPSPAEILARTATEDWMRGDRMARALKEKSGRQSFEKRGASRLGD